MLMPAAMQEKSNKILENKNDQNLFIYCFGK
jgi:hypothetical protein